MKTFSEAIQKVQQSQEFVFYENCKALWPEIHENKLFKYAIRDIHDQIVVEMTKGVNPSLAICSGLTAVFQAALLIGMEMEKE
jgi:hypothetical protein